MVLIFQGTVLEISPGPISAADRDLGINAPVYYSASGDGAALLRLHRDSGALAATERLLTHPLPITVVLKVPVQHFDSRLCITDETRHDGE